MMYSGSLGCRGCGWSMMVRYISDIFGEDTVYVVPACCFSIIAGPYPMNALKSNIVHTLFAASAATASGVRAGLDAQGKNKTQVVVLAGDGGTFDIGLQALSGAAVRNENIVYICNNNGAYMNTGIQSSSATPMGAVTTTEPSVHFKKNNPKDLMAIIKAHQIPYSATASLAFLEDYRMKLQKAKKFYGFRFLMVDGICPPGHKIEPEDSIKVARLAVNSLAFPLFEIVEGKTLINHRPENPVRVTEYLRPQGRFKHLFSANGNGGNENPEILEEIQRRVDERWLELGGN